MTGHAAAPPEDKRPRRQPSPAGESAPSARDPRAALARNIPVISVTAAFASTWYLAWSPVLPLLLGQRDAPATAIAVTFALVNIGTAFAQYFGGRLADRIGIRRVIGWTGITLGFTWLGMAAVSGEWLGLAFCYALGNTLFGLQSTAFITVVSDSVPTGRRLQAFSYYQFWSAASLVLGPIAGGLLLLPHLSPPMYLGATGLAYMSVGLMRLFVLREPRSLPAAAGPRVTLQRLADAAAGGPDRRELLLVTCGVTLAFALTVNGPFIALAAHALDHLQARVVELFFGIGPVGALAVSMLASRLRGHRTSLVLGLWILALAVAAMALPLGRLMLGASFLLAFAGFQAAQVGFSTLRVQLAGQESVGEVLGATSAIAGIGAFLGLMVAGLAGFRGGLLLGSGVALVTAAWQGRIARPAGTRAALRGLGWGRRADS